MASSGMLRRVTLVRTDVSEGDRVTRIGEIGTTLAVTTNRRRLRRSLTNNVQGITRIRDKYEVTCEVILGYV
jgi:hypothetical protein